MKSAIIAASLLVALATPTLAEERPLFKDSGKEQTMPPITGGTWNISPLSQTFQTAFRITKDADPSGVYSLVLSDNPDLSVCIFKLGEECVLGYDGKTHAIVATRTINAWGGR